MDAYERLIGDAMRGDGLLFAGEDAVEAAWRIVDPALRHPGPALEYACRQLGARRRRCPDRARSAAGMRRRRGLRA